MLIRSAHLEDRRGLKTRTAFGVNEGPRRLRTCHMERDTMHSNLRMLAKQFGDPLQDAIFTTF